MHDEIKKFSLSGELADGNVVSVKERLVHHVEGLMRDYSFVPALDLEPQFTLDYVPAEERFDFTLSIYGVKVEKGTAWKISGMMNGKPTPRYTPQAK